MSVEVTVEVDWFSLSEPILVDNPPDGTIPGAPFTAPQGPPHPLEGQVAPQQDEHGGIEGPGVKRFKVAGDSDDGPLVVREETLEDRLNGILSCVVCRDLSNLMIYQCTNGHLMCASCLWHLLADSRLRDETATCPSCRCEINCTLCVRNLAVEKAISELPSLCQYCSKQMPQCRIVNHESEVCAKRLVRCTYTRIGCQWHGMHRDRSAHETECVFPKMSGLELMETIGQIHRQKEMEFKLYQSMLNFLSYEKVMITDAQLCQQFSNDSVPKLFFESVRFTAFALPWVVKAQVNDLAENSRHCGRSLSYQLILKSKPAAPMRMLYIALQGPFGETRLNPENHESEFTTDMLESAYHELPVGDTGVVNRLLTAKTFNLRFLLIHLPSK